MTSPNKIEKSNCKIVVETLNHFKEPCTLTKIVNHISKDQNVRKTFLIIFLIIKN